LEKKSEKIRGIFLTHTVQLCNRSGHSAVYQADSENSRCRPVRFHGCSTAWRNWDDPVQCKLQWMKLCCR